MAKVAFTVPRINAFKCPADKRQCFMWDSTAPGLGLRATPSGKPSYVFQGVYQGKDIRITIGNTDAWRIPDAQAKARELQRLIDEGKDPRQLKRDAIAAQAAQDQAQKIAAITVAQAWHTYIQERTPYWGHHHIHDHERLARSGGQAATRGTRGAGVTNAGPLFLLMHLPLRDLNASTIEAWAIQEGKTRPTAARLAWRLLRTFLTWCAEHPEYSAIVPDTNPAKTRKSREALGKPKVKQDALRKEQLPAWFAQVQAIPNPVVAAYLQTLLLTGARPGEVLGLLWEDLDTKWRSMKIRDKVEGERTIPLTPYVHHLLAHLPRRNAYVFASERKADAPITEPNHAHDRACERAAISDLTLHGLRRSFKSLTEWLDVPAGIVAQLQGHKPSATAEKHYTVRPLDLLRVHHERIEKWVLEHAQLASMPAPLPSEQNQNPSAIT